MGVDDDIDEVVDDNDEKDKEGVHGAVDDAVHLGAGSTLANRSLPSFDKGRTREAWRTKKTNTRQAMRSVRADTKEGTWGDGAGWNWDRYSDLTTNNKSVSTAIDVCTAKFAH